MKFVKILSAILAALLLITSVTVSAAALCSSTAAVKEKLINDPASICPSGNQLSAMQACYNSAVLAVDGEWHSFLENEYYRAYADYFAQLVLNEQSRCREKISAAFAKQLADATEDLYLSVVFDRAIKTADELAATLQIDPADVLAYSDAYAVAMIKIPTEKLPTILASSTAVFVCDAFAAFSKLHTVFNESIYVAEYSPTAADARKILRYAAKLDGAPKSPCEGKQFFFACDANLDGKLDAADARKALRIAAGLENGSIFYKENSGCGAFWAD